MTQSTTSRTKTIASCGLLTALALIFSYIEFLVPINLGAPGIKLGLANIVVVICIYGIGPKYAAFVNLVRVLLAALLFGSMFSAVYALSGAVVSFAGMLLLKKTDLFSMVGVSMAGGVFHNLGQIIVAACIMQTKGIILYFPVLLIAGMLTGIINGVISTLVIRKIRFQLST